MSDHTLDMRQQELDYYNKNDRLASNSKQMSILRRNIHASSQKWDKLVKQNVAEE